MQYKVSAGAEVIIDMILFDPVLDYSQGIEGRCTHLHWKTGCQQQKVEANTPWGASSRVKGKQAQ